MKAQIWCVSNVFTPQYDVNPSRRGLEWWSASGRHQIFWVNIPMLILSDMHLVALVYITSNVDIMNGIVYRFFIPMEKLNEFSLSLV